MYPFKLEVNYNTKASQGSRRAAPFFFITDWLTFPCLFEKKTFSALTCSKTIFCRAKFTFWERFTDTFSEISQPSCCLRRHSVGSFPAGLKNSWATGGFFFWGGWGWEKAVLAVNKGKNSSFSPWFLTDRRDRGYYRQNFYQIPIWQGKNFKYRANTDRSKFTKYSIPLPIKAFHYTTPAF